MPSSGDSRRVRVERGIYRQKNGKSPIVAGLRAVF